MKIRIKIFLLTMTAMLAVVQGCNSILEEEPKTSFTTAYFETAQGFQDGINTAYSYMRFQYGCNPALGLNETGTDEITYGPEPSYQTGGDNLPHKLYGTYNIAPSTDFLGVTFGRTFPVINMLNMLVAMAPNVPGLTETQRNQMLGEIRYFRAHYYYVLVAQFGKVPLNLGSGDLNFNTSTEANFYRLDDNLLAKNFQVMIDDLNFAKENLISARPTGQFKVSKAVALHLLAKVYMFRGYSTEAQATDFQMAYETAKTLIDNQGAYGAALQQNFFDVFKQGNDYNSEILFATERIPKDHLNNGYPSGGPGGIGDVENMSNNNFTCNYEQPTLRIPANADVIDGRPFAFQRPLRKLTPTGWLLNTAFADKTNDSRYHNSFRTLYTCDTQNPSGSTGYTTFVNALAALNPPRAIGDTAFYLADTDEQAAAMQNKYYRVYGPSVWYTNQLYVGNGANALNVYPSLRKFDDIDRADRNHASGRPMPVFRLAETYLIAAEAAMKTGKASEALAYIKVIRERAAFRPGLSAQELSDRKARMMKKTTGTAIDADPDLTPGDITLDFILDERARELCGESLRWTDLAMRGDDVFVNRVKLNPDAAPNVKPYHRLRPIPQFQLDAISDPDKAKYQNPGYPTSN